VAAEEAEGDEAGGKEEQYQQCAVILKRHCAGADQGLQETISCSHLPVGDGHFVCQELVDVPSVGLEEVFAVFQPGIFGDRFTDFASNVKPVNEKVIIMGVQG